MSSLRKHYRYCYFCQATCGVEIAIDEADKIVSVKGDTLNSLSNGFISACPPLAIAAEE
jgi:hypothetical protein